MVAPLSSAAELLMRSDRSEKIHLFTSRAVYIRMKTKPIKSD
jgi:hypothetical protein